ncbi:MAG: hypothetical protein AB1896_02775 [Thermodesulfobacteriota bacterium]
MPGRMADLAELLADEDTVLRGYIALAGVRVVGHKYMGPDRTLSVSFAHNSDIPEEEDVLWCYVEKTRGKAPLVFPVVDRADLEED